MSEIKVNLRQCSQGVDVNINQTEQDITASFYSGIMLVHDYTLQGNGTSSTPLGISQEILDRIDDVGKVNDVYVNGVSVLAADKIAYVIVPTNVSDLNNDLNFQTLTQVSNAISVHNESSTAHADIRQEIANVSDSISTSIATHNTSDSAHQDIRNLISDLSEWTTESYTATTTNFVVGNTYTVEEAFQRTASLFEGQQGEIDDIEALIPAQATTQNQLADKNFVNATIATNSANFRGNWATWTYVPTQADQYPEDYVGSRTPTNNDYMVVSDASDYISPTSLSHEISVVNLHATKLFTISITDDTGATTEYFYNDGFRNVWKAINETYSLRYSPGAPGVWYIKTNKTTETNIVINGTVYPVDPSGTSASAGAILFNTSYSTDPVSVGIPASAGQYQGTWRFLYVGTWATDGKNGWKPVYQIGTAFTQEQQAAIDSKITLEMVENYVNPTSTANTAYNKRITALETDKRDIINSANKVYATDANGANKNDLVYTTAATADTIAQRGTNGVLKVGTPTEDADATTKLYVDTMASTKQNTLTAGTNISIVNDVISSTAQESFFRGRWTNWSNVPSNSNLYPEDYHGNRTPTNNDYMVVSDASDYVPDLSNVPRVEFRNMRTKPDGVQGASICDVYYYPDGISEIITYNFDCIKNEDYTSVADGKVLANWWYGHDWTIKANATVYYNESYYNSGDVIYNGGNRDTIKIYFLDSVNTYEGSWRFMYVGTWDTEGKAGWIPEYQLENVLPIATDTEPGITKLYTTTGSNTDGSMTQGSITTALGTKQDTLTAGTNIDITNNVISSTAQESFFRGKWNTWSNVPTDANLYPSDYKGSHIPTESDYMVVEDASGFVPGLDIELFIPQTGTRAFTLGGEQKTVPDYPDEVSWELPDITITASFHNGIDSWFTANKTVKCKNIIYAPGETFAKIPYYNNPGPTIYYSNNDSLSGAWRFAYRGTWATDNISGWKPEYQVEDVLPIATDTEVGIAKLYTTTGSNTDGAIDQNGTTTAINTAVSTHNTASNAHSNIRGTANGLATLDANAKVPLTQMNDALVGNVSYQGLWNAATNDPFLQDPTGGLPSGYQALGYIDLNGGYIDTLISFDSSTDEIQYDFNLEIVAPSATIANRRIFGAASGYNGYDLANSAGSLYNRHNWESGYFASAGSNQSILNNVSRIDSNTFKMVLNRTNNAMAVYVNGSLNANINVTQGTYTTNTVYIGTCHLDSGAATNICPYQRYQYFKITKDGVLAGDFRPAKRLADGVIGFFDVVSNTFFTNLGSGTFTGGGSIEIPKGHYYITSTAGTQFGIHFEVGDWIISTGTSWSKVNNTDAVSSVEGRTGNVTVINDNASTGATTYTWSADKLETKFGSLGTAAYTATTDYATAAQGAKADTALQPADVQEYTANEVETLWNSI